MVVGSSAGKAMRSFALGCVRIAPDSGELRGELEDAAALFVVDDQPVGRALTTSPRMRR
jgi:hypothetical protein